MRKIFLSMFIAAAVMSMVIAPMVATQAIDVNGSVVTPKVLSQESGNPINVLIQTRTKDYRSVTSQVMALGGEITRQFKYASGLAAEIPSGVIGELRTHPNIQRISLDEVRYLTSAPSKISPRGLTELDTEDITLSSMTAQEIKASAMTPNTYWNYKSMGAEDVWATGNMGQGSLAVIIDTGIYTDHVMFGHGNVIGGVDLSADVGTPYEGWNVQSNHWHGTHVGGILAGAAALNLPPDHYIYRAWSKYTGMDTGGYIELLGMAPLCQLYGIKIYDHTGAGVPDSDIIYSMEYAIDLHLSGTYDVDIISMSLGGGTGFDGRDLMDQTVDFATSVGITVVTSTGNEGPASMTGGSPGSANTAISVAAAMYPVNTKTFMEAIYGIGDFVMPDNGTQITAFSSRGPTSDGRDKPTVSATGDWVLSGTTSGPGGLAWAGGTSQACPAVSGTVALMNSWSESTGAGASPYDYKEAIKAGAIWIDGYDKYDQGTGFLNAPNALEALMNDPSLGDEHPSISYYWPRWCCTKPAKPKGINTNICGSGTFTYTVEQLPIGRAVDFYIRTTSRTRSMKIELTDVETGVNPIGFNGFELFVQSPVRTTDDYFIDSWVYDDATFEFSDFSTTWSGGAYVYGYQDMILQPGYVRVVLQNEWDSYDWMSGTIKITVEKDPWRFRDRPEEWYYGFLTKGDEVTKSVGFGTAGVKLELSWYRDWTCYPTSDIDMFIYWFDGVDWHTDYSGAVFRSPEGVVINSPDIQEIIVTIIGSETYDRIEPWILQVYYLE
ncbi:MAG: S8 family serine peptidase [Promethearchaeota archaeon]